MVAIFAFLAGIYFGAPLAYFLLGLLCLLLLDESK